MNKLLSKAVAIFGFAAFAMNACAQDKGVMCCFSEGRRPGGAVNPFAVE